MLFDKYKDEQEFRSEFVRPLLTKLGFLSIAELDGPQEFGKDFVFSEITPFGFIRHYGVVVKHLKSIKQTSQPCSNVLSQIKQAFTVKFQLPDSANETHISSVLVMNSGNITPGAIKELRSALNFEKYGENTHIFDNERLSQLDQSATFSEQQAVIPRLQGLAATLNLNRVVWSNIEKHLPEFPESRGCFTQALEDYIASPFLTDRINLSEVSILLQECRIINAINTRYLMGAHGGNKEIKIRESETIKNIIRKASERSMKIDLSIQQCVLEFKTIAF